MSAGGCPAQHQRQADHTDCCDTSSPRGVRASASAHTYFQLSMKDRMTCRPYLRAVSMVKSSALRPRSSYLPGDTCWVRRA